MDIGQAFGVLVTGILVVFLVLILLTIIIKIYGTIVHRAGSGKSGSTGKGKPELKEIKPVDTKSPVVKAAVSVPAAGGIPQEIVAVIAAAVASIEDGASYTVRSIKKSVTPASARNAWSMAGLLENTRPF